MGVNNAYTEIDLCARPLSIQKHAVTFTTVVSSIGGQVGLWIGLSVVTCQSDSSHCAYIRTVGCELSPH
ncbi:MAG: amiloride-sensitive sodium channel family protein [Mesoflavibacter sp.]|nr:amiloride-sensitive sodium channel family protein [Mesoflavibacter sp.]